MADIVQSLLASVYRHAATEIQRKELENNEHSDDESEQSDDESEFQKTLNLRKWEHWKANPISEVWKESSATIRLVSGNEIFVKRGTLEELSTLRNFYRHIRECLHLPKHISLRLTFIGCRIFGREWREHVVACGDDQRGCHYLRGAIIQAVMHP